MNWKVWLIIGVIIAGVAIVAATTIRAKPGQQSNPPGEGAKIREPAVAGAFYPGEKEVLSEMVDRFLAKVNGEASVGNVRGLVCPHAGYIFSGQTAACGYKQLLGREIQTVIIMGPSHTTFFRGASIPNVDAYRTPLGTIGLSPKAKKLAGTRPFVSNPYCHIGEHSVEVQLPFVQKVLKDFTIIPIVFGQVDEEEAAGAISRYVDDATLLVASSDLSHYYPYETACRMDASCIKAICDLDIQKVKEEEACGKSPILALMHIAKKKGWRARLLDYRNSGDTAGERSRVVGYAAIAFFEPGGSRDLQK